jgi:arylsulfatase A-like enzyme
MNTFNTRIISFCFLLIITSSCSFTGQTSIEKEYFCRGCNVIMIGVDTFRTDHMHAAGYERETTPGLDAIAKQGILFTEAIAPSSWTVPSFMSIMTGVDPSVHGVVNKYTVFNNSKQILSDLRKISPQIETLAEAFKKAGYATGGFTGDAGVSGKFGYDHGFDVYTDEQVFGGFENSEGHALAWLDKLPTEKKFFMFLHGYDLHGQFALSKGYRSIYASKTYQGLFKGTSLEEAKLREDQLIAPLTLSKEDAEFWVDWYDSKLHDADARLTVFIKELEHRGLLGPKTILVVVSDHGEEFYEHRGFDHGQSLYDELIHVPIIFKLPGLVGGQKVNAQVSTIDIAPTLLKILDIAPSEAMAKQFLGRKNLMSYFFNPDTSGYDVFSETDYRNFTHKRSVRTADGWKFIHSLKNGEVDELYHLASDPKELINLTKDNPTKTTELKVKLEAHIKNDLHANPNIILPVGCLPVYKGECE